MGKCEFDKTWEISKIKISDFVKFITKGKKPKGVISMFFVQFFVKAGEEKNDFGVGFINTTLLTLYLLLGVIAIRMALALL